MIWLGGLVFLMVLVIISVNGCSSSYWGYRKDKREIKESARIKEKRKKEARELYDKAVERHKRLQSKETQEQMRRNKKKTK